MLIASGLGLVASLQFGLAGPCDCHVYAIQGPRGAVLIDSGAGTHTGRLLANLKQDFGSDAVAAIVLTHAHADHFGGASELQARTGCEVYTPELSRRTVETGDEDACYLTKAKQRGGYPPEVVLKPCTVTHGYVDGESFEAGGVAFKAVHVRGHSYDAFALLHGRYLFSGDVLFYGGVLGVINTPDSGMPGYCTDLPKLASTGAEALMPGHGLFTLRDAQRHIDAGLAATQRGFLPRVVGQGDIIF